MLENGMIYYTKVSSIQFDKWLTTYTNKVMN